VKAAQAKWRNENPEKATASTNNWRAQNAEKYAAARAEYDRQNADANLKRYAAYRAKNKQLLRDKAKAARDRDVDGANARVKAWRALNAEKTSAYWHNRRARIKGNGGRLSRDIRAKLTALQKGKCACCRVPLRSTQPHLDHIVPLVLGGRNEDQNMQLLCRLCNLQKHAKHPIDFMQNKGFLL